MYSRTTLLYGDERMARIRSAHVLVVGTGGVGAYAAEMLCRAGVGHLTLVDADTVSPSNINRQLPALHSTLGRSKVSVLAERFRDINPEVQLTLREEYLTPESVDALLEAAPYAYVIDAIDTIQPKVALLAACIRRRQPVIASMGAGAKTDITAIQYADLWQTYHCGLSKSVRNGLARAGLRGRKLPVVFCTQQADRNALLTVEGERNKKTTAGTVSFMPATFGNYLAAWVLNHL
ncbi:MAG: tRNA threonylcarbamoyladenosine dehydratase [Bacteroidales bacterium]|nr:tRNA threonylcarbamoyladenosine dehydratase [Bacteroidales bacterium]MDD7233731.1 tRNA threonylcarbamoyladenosine dehydratase [Bacteroidales bacterium]MDY2705984.1 tRNA threonylcarbamoyladenosine dehydratase [Alloprevotella sp.]